MASLMCMAVGAGCSLGISAHVFSHPKEASLGSSQGGSVPRTEAARHLESLGLNAAFLSQATEVLFRFKMWVNRRKIDLYV